MKFIIQKTLVIGCVAAITFSCGKKNQTQNDPLPNDTTTSGIDVFVGNYVTDGYSKKAEGYDWVAVTITKLSDSTAHVSIRSRADKKKPTCTFDMDVTQIDSVTLNGRNEGYAILFKLDKNVLTISSDQANASNNNLQYFCSGGATIEGNYAKIEGELDQQQIDKVIFSKVLQMKTYSFQIELLGQELSILPSGLSIDNSKMSHTIEGVILNAEIGDLNIDGYPEVLVYYRGKDNHGNIIGYSVNKGKSMSMIAFPNIQDNAKANKGYAGFDEFAIVENNLIQRFEVYSSNDAGSSKTGNIRQIQYNLKDGEASRILVANEITEYPAQ
jgi:hypothetical protein